MIGLHNLKFAKGSRRKVKRIGRGQGSGHGGTATRGHKGYGARSGSGVKRNFEGGQMPLIRRLPKVGFTSPFKIEFVPVNVETLEKFSASGKLVNPVTPESLYKVGIISKKNCSVKILGNGELKTKLDITAHKFSKSAIEKITALGGTTKTLDK